jgi:hypothetical protein
MPLLIWLRAGQSTPIGDACKENIAKKSPTNIYGVIQTHEKCRLMTEIIVLTSGGLEKPGLESRSSLGVSRKSLKVWRWFRGFR